MFLQIVGRVPAREDDDSVETNGTIFTIDKTIDSRRRAAHTCYRRYK